MKLSRVVIGSAIGFAIMFVFGIIVNLVDDRSAAENILLYFLLAAFVASIIYLIKRRSEKMDKIWDAIVLGYFLSYVSMTAYGFIALITLRIFRH